MRPPTSPLLGYNTNIRHKGKLYHIQTEDSGVNRPHIITHLFADGGRIVASVKTDYAQHLESESLQSLVKSKMQQQHKAMLIALRDGQYDDEATLAPPTRSMPAARAASKSPVLDVETLERAARARLAGSRALAPVARKVKRAPAPPATARSVPPPKPTSSGRKPRTPVPTLDDVIRSYLDDDPESGR